MDKEVKGEITVKKELTQKGRVNIPCSSVLIQGKTIRVSSRSIDHAYLEAVDTQYNSLITNSNRRKGPIQQRIQSLLEYEKSRWVSHKTFDFLHFCQSVLIRGRSNEDLSISQVPDSG